MQETRSATTSSEPTNRLRTVKNIVFRGGGPKGIVYAPFIEQIRQTDAGNGKTVAENVELLIGSSAGALTASLLAFNASQDQINHLLCETKFLDLLDNKAFSIAKWLHRAEHKVADKFLRMLKIRKPGHDISGSTDVQTTSVNMTQAEFQSLSLREQADLLADVLRGDSSVSAPSDTHKASIGFTSEEFSELTQEEQAQLFTEFSESIDETLAEDLEESNQAEVEYDQALKTKARSGLDTGATLMKTLNNAYLTAINYNFPEGVVPLSEKIKSLLEARANNEISPENLVILQEQMQHYHQVVDLVNEISTNPNYIVKFRDLNALHQLFPEKFKRVKMTATNIKTHSLEVFDYERHPHMPVALAARISSGLPPIMKVCIYERLDADGNPTGEIGYYIDGGAIDNYAVKLIIEKLSSAGSISCLKAIEQLRNQPEALREYIITLLEAQGMAEGELTTIGAVCENETFYQAPTTKFIPHRGIVDFITNLVCHINVDLCDRRSGDIAAILEERGNLAQVALPPFEISTFTLDTPQEQAQKAIDNAMLISAYRLQQIAHGSRTERIASLLESASPVFTESEAEQQHRIPITHVNLGIERIRKFFAEHSDSETGLNNKQQALFHIFERMLESSNISDDPTKFLATFYHYAIEYQTGVFESMPNKRTRATQCILTPHCPEREARVKEREFANSLLRTINAAKTDCGLKHVNLRKEYNKQENQREKRRSGELDSLSEGPR